MKPYTLKELQEVAHRAGTDIDYNGGVEALERTRGWIDGFPPAVRAAAALALSVAKWHPGNTCRGIGGFVSCGCCAVWVRIGVWSVTCDNACPLVDLFPDETEFKCVRGDREVDQLAAADEIYNGILAKYREAYDALPAKWKGGAS